ncbi:MAG TPA: hypothetical protein PLR99_27080 [Polyangiaceae bacterium]|nr:hypothetical protein [Polyangiaceae bacterium]
MRIALLNNCNNIMFSIARHLRARGHDATLLLMDHERVDWPHFHPSFDAFDLDYQNYTREVAWGDASAFASHDAELVRRDLAPYDFTIGCGSAPAYLARIGRTLDVFVPVGYDLCQAPFDPPRLNLRSLRSLVEYPLAQRAGIRASRSVLAAESPECFDPALKRLGYGGRRVYAHPPMLEPAACTSSAVAAVRARSPWYRDVLALRARTDVLVNAHGRHLWKSVRAGERRHVETNPSYTKGNDKLIRGVAAARARRPGARIGVVSYEYGPDVRATKDLAEELGVAENILWLPTSARKDVLVNLSLADLACGELGPLSWLMIGTAAEVLAMGKPLFHRRDDALFVGRYPELYPRIDVQSAEDVTRGILGFLDEPERFRAMGEAGRDWFNAHVIERGVAALLELIEARRSPGAASS